MDAKLVTLTLILERMDVLYGRMFDLLTRERRCLIEFNFDELLIEMREKDEILAALRALDRDRLRIQDQFAILMNKSSDEISLRSLAEMLIEQGGNSVDQGMRIMQLREKVAASVAALRDKVERNNDFIERSISNLQGIASRYIEAAQGRPSGAKGGKKGSNVYTGKAKYQSPAAATGTIVEKRF